MNLIELRQQFLAQPEAVLRPMLTGLLLALTALWYSYDSGEINQMDRAGLWPNSMALAQIWESK